MKRTEYNAKFRQHARDNLSPKQNEKDLVTRLYSAIQNVLGTNSCIQIGSYPRFTAHTPLHDLDILYFAGQYAPHGVDPRGLLNSLKQQLDQRLVVPTGYRATTSLQSHSVTIVFSQNGRNDFAIDIVPAYTSGYKNEFNDDIYWVPELANVGRSKRGEIYLSHQLSNTPMGFIKSDPRGYIRVAQQVNQTNEDFRKAVKFVKAWKHGCKQIDENFKLKSFHIEQVITRYFLEDNSLDLFGAMFRFFKELESIIERPQIPDRADQSIFMDAYIDDLTDSQKTQILQARDFFMNKIEHHTSASPIPLLLTGGFYRRKSDAEQFLFDVGIPTFIDDAYDFVVDGKVEKKDGFRGGYWLSSNQDKAPVGLKIYFQLTKNTTGAPLCKWKVKNSDSCEQPRGEVNDHRTRNHPESTAYKGTHYVECYAIKNGECVARHKRNVIIT